MGERDQDSGDSHEGPLGDLSAATREGGVGEFAPEASAWEAQGPDEGAEEFLISGEGAADGRGYSLGTNFYRAPRLESGLYIVSTPIGNLRDITLRALETLAGADLIACEDTRMTSRLLQRYGLRVSMIPYHEHNAAKQRPRLLDALNEGKVIALVSDAGTPLISDPGYRLVGEVVERGHKVIPIPGASAMLAGLVGAGLPSDTLTFAGFLPQKSGQRLRRLSELSAIPSTLIFYESPHRIAAALEAMEEALGGSRRAAVARELTKRFETFERGTLSELAERFRDEKVKGEIVVLVAPPPAAVGVSAEEADDLLRAALVDMQASAAAKFVSKRTGVDRKTLYRRALEIKTEREDRGA